MNSISSTSVDALARDDSAELLYNHTCSSLSDLDMEIICSVPPGGNWQDIPDCIVEKSARLTQIRNSGGRTTYYGRLSNHLPSYTVNTYFNRPGNGSFIHPVEDRLISMREAARLQSFPDHFRFLGSFSSRFKQIGNAVPPLLARAVAEMIKSGLVVDLFSGAGGLSEGFAQAGNDIIVGSDMNAHMCETYAYNHPQTQVVQADVSSMPQRDKLLEVIENTLSGKTLTSLIGGPPCQGDVADAALVQLPYPVQGHLLGGPVSQGVAPLHADELGRDADPGVALPHYLLLQVGVVGIGVHASAHVEPLDDHGAAGISGRPGMSNHYPGAIGGGRGRLEAPEAVLGERLAGLVGGCRTRGDVLVLEIALRDLQPDRGADEGTVAAADLFAHVRDLPGRPITCRVVPLPDRAVAGVGRRIRFSGRMRAAFIVRAGGQDQGQGEQQEAG